MHRSLAARSSNVSGLLSVATTIRALLTSFGSVCAGEGGVKRVGPPSPPILGGTRRALVSPQDWGAGGAESYPLIPVKVIPWMK